MANNLDLSIKIRIDDRDVAGKLRLSEAQLRKLGSSFSSVRSGANDSSVAVNRLAGHLRTLGQLAATAFGVAQVAQFGKAIYQTTGNIQSVTALLKSVSGSSEGAAAQIAILRQTSDQLGRNFLQSAQQFAFFAAAAKEAGLSLQETNAVFFNFQTALSGLQVSNEVAQRVFTALTQMTSNPRVALEELKTQLGEALPGVISKAARAIGTDTQTLLDKISKGELVSAEFIKAFSQVLAKDFPAVTQGAIQSANRLENAWNDTKIALGDSGFVDALASGLERISQTLRSHEAQFSRWGQSLASAINTGIERADALVATLSGIGGALIGLRLGGLPGALIGGGAGILLSPRIKTGVGETKKNLSELTAEYGALTKKIGDLKRSNDSNPLRPFTAQLADSQNRAKGLLAQISAITSTQQPTTAAADVLKVDRAKLFAPARPVAAPRSGGGGGARIAAVHDDTAQIIGARIDAEKAAVEVALRLQQDGQRREEEALRQSLDRKTISEEAYYRKLGELRNQGIDAEIAAKQKEIDLAQRELANAGKEPEQLRIRSEIARITSEITILERQRGDVAAEALTKQIQKERDLAQQKADLFQQIMSQTAQGRAVSQLDEENQFVQAARSAGASLAQINSGIDVIRAKYDQTSDGMSQFAIQGARNLQSAFADFLFDPFSQGLNGMLLGFVNIIRRMAAEALAAKLFEKLLGTGNAGLFGSSPGTGSGSVGWLQMLGNVIGSFFHEGGIVGGAPTFTRPLSPLVFAAAPRFHGGGFPGLKANEVPAILQKGEEVLTERDPRHAANGGNSGAANIRIINSIDPDLARDFIESPRGEQVLHNYISRNSATIRQLLA